MTVTITQHIQDIAGASDRRWFGQHPRLIETLLSTHYHPEK